MYRSHTIQFFLKYRRDISWTLFPTLNCHILSGSRSFVNFPLVLLVLKQAVLSIVIIAACFSLELSTPLPHSSLFMSITVSFSIILFALYNTDMLVCMHVCIYVCKWLYETFKVSAKPAWFYNQHVLFLELHHFSLGESNKIYFRSSWLPFIFLPLP